MGIEAAGIFDTVLVGAGATLLMDLWNLLLKRAFGLESLNYCLLGRWLRHMPDGTFRHASITAASSKSFECVVGWCAHYAIGVVFALVFLGLVSRAWLAQPTLGPALLFGLGTVVFPFFVMQPALGLGVASSKAASSTRARLKSLSTHTAFGVGLYLSGLALGVALRGRP